MNRIECQRGSIEEFCRDLIEIAKLARAPVMGRFNGAEFLADEDDNAPAVKKRYCLALKVKGQEDV